MTVQRVSILMPVRDEAQTITECLDSIQSQTLEDWELVAVNDGSNDESEKLLKEAAECDPRIRVISTGPLGIVPALNTGISACGGHYIARMDCDDRMHPERLETQLKFLERHHDIDFCGCCVEPFTTEGPVSENVMRYHRWSNSLLHNEDIKRDLYVESPIMHPSFFSTRKLFEFLGGYLEQPWAEDYDLLLRAALEKIRFGKCSETLLEKRHGKDRLSRRDPIYKRPAMMRAKVHYLLESGVLKRFDGVLIVGTGPTGREMAKAFLERKVPLAGFVDNRHGPPERRVLDFPAWGFPERVPVEFLRRFPDRLIVLGIGDSEGQAKMTRLLRENGWKEKEDFLRMA